MASIWFSPSGSHIHIYHHHLEIIFRSNTLKSASFNDHSIIILSIYSQILWNLFFSEIYILKQLAIIMLKIPVWLSRLFDHKRHHTIENRHPNGCVAESDEDSSAVVRSDKLPVENFDSIADDQESSAAAQFEELPVEIFQRIMDFLPLHSAACLILSRKRLDFTLGERTLRALRANKRERLNFLLTMQKDWKELVICFPCEKLHPVMNCPSLETSLGCCREAPCTMADGVIELWYRYVLRWHHAHMIMRLNAQNPMNHNWIQALSCDEFDNNVVSWVHWRGRIAKKHLLMKMEYRLMLRENEEDLGFRRNRVKICPHWHTLDWDQNLKKMFHKMLECRTKHDTTKPCLLCNSMIQCPWCTTEFVMSVIRCDWSLYRSALYITAWKDLGPCETPFDNSWRTQSRRKDKSLDISEPPHREPVHFEPGSIRNAYEELGYPKIEGDGIASKWPLDCDVEHFRRLDQCSKPDPAFSKIMRRIILNAQLQPLFFPLPSLRSSLNRWLMSALRRISTHTDSLA